MKRCQFCQAENVDDAVFCDLCGASLGTPPAPVGAFPLPSAVPAPPPVLSTGPHESQAYAKAKCAVCGAAYAQGQAICDNCGAHLVPLGADAGLASATVVPAAAPAAVLPPPNWPEPLASAPVAMPEIPQGAKPGTLQMLTPRSAAPPPGHPRLMIASSGMYFDLFSRTDITIGRVDPVSGVFPEIDLTVHGGEEGGVSRRHCRITLAGNQYFAEDLGSTNGTWIGATRLQEGVRTALNNGDQLRLGKLVLSFFAGC